MLVGPHKQAYIVEKGLLCQCSAFFDRAIRGRFEESEEMKVHLETESVRVIRLFLHWIDTREVRIPPKAWSPASLEQSSSSSPAPLVHERESEECAVESAVPEEPDVAEGQEWIQRNLIDLYIFADRRAIPELRNDIITTLITLDESPRDLRKLASAYFDHVRLAYSNLPKSSTLLEFLVAEAVWFWRDTCFSHQDLPTLPPDFLASVLCGVSLSRERRNKETYTPWRRNLCQFHEHDSDQAIEDCMQRNKDLQSSLRQKIKAKSRGPSLGGTGRASDRW